MKHYVKFFSERLANKVSIDLPLSFIADLSLSLSQERENRIILSKK